jgi:hypothetical protein
MGTTTVNQIVDRAQIVLQDDNLRWLETELITWVNDAHRAIVLMRPDAGMRKTVFTCAAGTFQDLTDANGRSDAATYDAIRLRSVTRNLLSGFAGRAIRHEAQRVLDDQLPTWHQAAATTACQFYVHDPANPTAFYLYPPPSPGHTVEVIYSAAPKTALTGASAIVLDDAWVPTILDYVLYRAYTKDAEYTANLERAAAHYKTFIDAIQANQAAQQNMLPLDDGRVTANRT